MNKILVIEDDKLIQNNLYDLLTSEDYSVDCASNGIEGIEKVNEFYPDLIICDVMMPKLNGFEVLEELQKDNSTATIPFLFLTAKTEMQNLRQGMRLGADDYLLKPFDVEEVLEAVKTRIRKKEINNNKLKQMQEQIAHKLPHDLRTPLVPILGYAEMIESEDDIDQIKSMIKTIRTSGKVLQNRIEKFLLYKDLLLNEINKSDEISHPAPTQISSDLVSYYSSSIPEEFRDSERIKINIQPSLLAINDWYLKIVFTELIENGLRYSDENSTVDIEGIIKEDRYNIKITDSGKGMTKDQIKSISAFNKFSEDSIPESGFGLGLAIVEKLITLHGGTFSISSAVGKYTECIIALPITKMNK